MARLSLTRADYLRAAFEITKESGFEALTLRSLGDKLGVDPTAVYRHFRSRDELLLEMLNQLLAPLLESDPALLTPRAGLETIARDFRKVVLDYPALAVSYATVWEAPVNTIRLTDRALAFLARLGVPDGQCVVCYQMLENYVSGAAFMDSSLGDQSMAARLRHYERIGSPAFRNAAVSVENVATLTEAAFEAGLKAILDAIESIAAGGASR